MEPLPLLETVTIEIFEKYAIKRNFEPGKLIYLCHWKSHLISIGVLNSSSLSFQEDDALLELYPRFPNPVEDWSVYKTLGFYFMKCYCFLSGTALNLLRGITDYPRLSKNPGEEVNEFISNVNHPGPSLTSIQRWIPSASYENKQFHRKYLQCHFKALSQNPAISIQFPNVVPYPVVLGVDDQGLNPGSFVENGILHGLCKKLSSNEIKNIVGHGTLPEKSCKYHHQDRLI